MFIFCFQKIVYCDRNDLQILIINKDHANNLINKPFHNNSVIQQTYINKISFYDFAMTKKNIEFFTKKGNVLCDYVNITIYITSFLKNHSVNYHLTALY